MTDKTRKAVKKVGTNPRALEVLENFVTDSLRKRSAEQQLVTHVLGNVFRSANNVVHGGDKSSIENFVSLTCLRDASVLATADLLLKISDDLMNMAQELRRTVQ